MTIPDTPSTPGERIVENPMPAIQIPHKRPTNIKRKQCVPSVLAMEIADRGRYRLLHATNSRTTADLQGHPPFSASVLGGTRITSDRSPSILLVPCLGHYLQDLRIVASSMSRRPTFASIVGCKSHDSTTAGPRTQELGQQGKRASLSIYVKHLRAICISR